MFLLQKKKLMMFFVFSVSQRTFERDLVVEMEVATSFLFFNFPATTQEHSRCLIPRTICIYIYIYIQKRVGCSG